TTPGSALLFPGLCAPTGDLPPPAERPAEPCGERTAMMPRRRRTRAQDRAYRVAAERAHNRQARHVARPERQPTYFGPAPPPGDGDDDPPPF
ncbi:hypothetical protein OQ789_25790, partial [Mycobacterium sp. 94-17]|nr:hypothetical protein [Mycobacterium sp. 94-17]